MNKKDVQKRLAALLAQMDEMIEAGLTDETRDEFDTIEAEAESLRSDLTRIEKQEARNKWANSPEDNDKETRLEMGDAPADKPCFRSLEDNLAAIIEASRTGARFDERLRPAPHATHEVRAASGLSEGTGAYGGFFLQADQQDKLLDPMFETGLLTPRVKQHTVTKQDATSVKYQVLDETDRGVGYRLGGLRLYTRAEAETVTASKPQWREWEVPLRSVMGLCYFTGEQIQDTPWLVNQVQNYFQNEAGYEIDDFIMNGDGASEPLGITNHDALIEQDVETGQDTNEPYLSENFMNMYARMPAKSRANAIWTHPGGALPYFMKLEFPGASSVPMWVPGNSLAAEPHDRVLNKPLVEIEQAPAVNTANDLMFIDPQQYLLVRKGGMQADLSAHVQFLYNEVVLRFVFRIGGGSWWNSAITPANDGDTIGPFIGLKVRS